MFLLDGTRTNISLFVKKPLTKIIWFYSLYIQKTTAKTWSCCTNRLINGITYPWRPHSYWHFSSTAHNERGHDFLFKPGHTRCISLDHNLEEPNCADWIQKKKSHISQRCNSCSFRLLLTIYTSTSTCSWSHRITVNDWFNHHTPSANTKSPTWDQSMSQPDISKDTHKSRSY